MRVSFFRLLLLASIALVFFGCASQGKNIMVDPDLAKLDYSGRYLAYYPTHANKIVVLNPADVKDDFQNEEERPNRVVADSFNSKAMGILGTMLTIGLQIPQEGVTFYNPDNESDKFSFFTYRVFEDSMAVEFYIPTTETLKEAGLQPDLILVVNDLVFDKTNESAFFSHNGPSIRQPSCQIGAFSPGMNLNSQMMTHSGSFESTCLTARVTFIIWDYWQNKPISWGTFRESEPMHGSFGKCTLDTWLDLFDNIIKHTFYRIGFIPQNQY